MRQNYSYLKDVAYYPYIPGLRKAGLTIEKIPSLQEMNDALGKINWGAVTVDGFIPPAAFMEYQANRVLVIAADIRKLEHIEYTSAPDIIHESAGHAPIISDNKYNQYLSYLGYIGTKALFSAKDFELYESIRQLSILKEVPNVDKRMVSEAEEKVLFLQKNLGKPSEMALLSRLQWWTVEYGLIGSLENPKIYGAGLLSSIGESSWCMRPEVKKLIYTIEALQYSYDITQPQPQLFVTPTFQNLIDVLQQFENKMAWRIGGLSGIEKAIDCKNTCTIVLDSGLQISGIVDSVNLDSNDVPVIIKTMGPTALCVRDKLISGLGPEQLPNGFMAILGHLKNHSAAPYLFNRAELKEIGLIESQQCALEFENGTVVKGVFKSSTYEGEKLIALHFQDALIQNDSSVFPSARFEQFTLTPATKVVSVFNGSADPAIFTDALYVSKERTWKVVYTEKDQAYQNIFKQVRAIRELNDSTDRLVPIWKILKENFPEDWLCSMEIIELLHNQKENQKLYLEVRSHLELLAEHNSAFTKLIQDGLKIVDRNLVFE